MEISELKGIGKTHAMKLEEDNIKTVEKLAIQSPLKISKILGISQIKAKELIDKARKATEGQIIIQTAKEILEERKKFIQRIPTGSSALDKILGGGIETNALTGFIGEFAAGKSQLSHQLVCNCKKYLDRKSAWIETEPLTYQADRIEEIAKNNGIEIDLDKDIFCIQSKYINSPDTQYRAYEIVEREINNKVDIGLLVIDSFNSQFRTSYSGREQLPERSQDIARHIGFLQYLASKYNIAIVLTNQVMGVPDSKLQGYVLKKYGIRTALVGPHILKHGVNYWISLDQVSSIDKIWKATVVDGPVPRNDCIFKIDAKGISDIILRKGRA